MPKADDPIEQARAQYKNEPGNIVEELTKKSFEKIPFVGIAIAYIRGKSREEKEEAFNNEILDILKSHEVHIDQINSKLEDKHVVGVIAAAVERIFWGASEVKIKRFAAVVADAIESNNDRGTLEDAVSFLRAIDELSEDDLKVLKHLYKHQRELVTENHTMAYNSFFDGRRMQNMLVDATNIGIQMDDFYARCGRLSGYGLAIPLQPRQGETGLNDFPYRMTLLGRRLMVILGAGLVG